MVFVSGFSQWGGCFHSVSEVLFFYPVYIIFHIFLYCHHWNHHLLRSIQTLYMFVAEYAMKHPVFTHARTKLYAIGGKMISREAVGTLRFDEELTHGEDTWFMFQVLANGADVSILFRNWYYYRIKA